MWKSIARGRYTRGLAAVVPKTLRVAGDHAL